MSPLPGSPLSRSEESNPQSQDASEEESESSLTTPRPGPSDPSQRTSENLSTPAYPAAEGAKASGGTESTSLRRTTFNTNIFSQPSERSSAYSRSLDDSAQRPSSQKSVSFSSGASLPKPERQGSYSLMSGQRKSTGSPSRMALADEMEGSSSADENTAIMRKSRGAAGNYGAAAGVAPDEGTSGDEVIDDPVGTVKRKRSNVPRGRRTKTQEQEQQNGNVEEEKEEHDSWWKALVEKYGSVELENKGSVARDHLALGTSTHRHASFPLSQLLSEPRTHLPGLAAHLTVLRQHRDSSNPALPSQHFTLRYQKPTNRGSSDFQRKQPIHLTRPRSTATQQTRCHARRHAQTPPRRQTTGRDIPGHLNPRSLARVP